jgi:hypothetical protein
MPKLTAQQINKRFLEEWALAAVNAANPPFYWVRSADSQPNEGDPEQQKKRLGGWQRKILKLEQERDVWRDHALANQLKAKEPEQAQVKEPQPPDIETFTGTTDEFKKALAEYPGKLREFLDKQRTEEANKRQFDDLKTSFNKRLSELPELPKMKEAATSAKVSERLANFMGSVASGLKNGTEVMKEALLDPETLEALVELG